jgi:hypothetical protein
MKGSLRLLSERLLRVRRCPFWVISGHVGLHEKASALYLKTDILRSGGNSPLCAMCGRLLVGKSELHVASLVGAAMCSAC